MGPTLGDESRQCQSHLRASDGFTLATFPAESSPAGVAFDGASTWVTDVASNTVTKLRPSDGVQLGTFATRSGPAGMAFDGRTFG